MIKKEKYLCTVVSRGRFNYLVPTSPPRRKILESQLWLIVAAESELDLHATLSFNTFPAKQNLDELKCSILIWINSFFWGGGGERWKGKAIEVEGRGQNEDL